MVAETFNAQKLTVGSLTGGEKEGAGIFDELMRSTKAHLEGEYKAKRITGDEYSKVYMASMQASMAQGSQYLLQYLITNQQVRLMDQQILEAEKNVELVQAQINQINKNMELTDEQITLAQKAQLQADQDLLNSKQQEELLKVQVTNAGKEGIILDNQAAQQLEQTKQIIQATANATIEATVLTNQASKLLSEIAVLNQKLVTGQAQTADTIGGLPVGGIVGKQMTLYTNQAEGFVRDAEQRVAKMYTDQFATRISVDYDPAFTDPTAAGMADPEVKTVLNKLREGVGINLLP